MRRRHLTGTLMLAGLAAVSAALAAQTTVARTPGSVALSLNSGHGLAVISSHGALLGRIRAGRIVATPNVVVRCWRYRKRLASGLIRYRGRGEDCANITLHVATNDGAWRLRIRGRGINVSGVAKGSLLLDGVDLGSTGLYSISGGQYRAWPRSARTYALSQ
jgi:hypothetical protein